VFGDLDSRKLGNSNLIAKLFQEPATAHPGYRVTA
jgi:hypothetical protein